MSNSMPCYADNNLFTRLYVEHSDTEAARKIQSQFISFPWTLVHQIEFPNSLWHAVFDGRNREQTFIDETQVLAILADYEEQLKRRETFRMAVLENALLLHQTRRLSDRHTAKHGFRSLDIMHVAQAIILNCKHFASFDAKARQLAAMEGLKLLPARLPSGRV
jgi:hypothetical protein